LPIRLMTAAEFVATGACEIFWFHGLSAGNRLDPSSPAEALVMGITSIVKTKARAVQNEEADEEEELTRSLKKPREIPL
jgi:hypothetical protein